MGILQKIFHLSGNLFFNRPAKKLTLTELAARLRDSGTQIGTIIETIPDTEFNRRLLNHVIGIERWSQRRVQVALGETLLLDEYDSYRPPRDQTWELLKTDFATTRQASVELAEQLADAKIDVDRVIPHNAYGKLTVRGWLRYMLVHADLEIKKFKKG